MDERPRSQIVGTRASLQITGVGSETLLSLYPLHGGQRDGRTWEAASAVGDARGVDVCLPHVQGSL